MSEMDLHDDGEDDRAGTGRPQGEVAADTPEADALEQRAEVRGHGDPLASTIPADVDPADRADQQRDVEMDEEEYR